MEREKPKQIIARNRGRMMRNRAGTWTLTYTIEGMLVDGVKRPLTPGSTGYVQLRGKRDDLVEHAAKLGIRDLHLPGRPVTMPIEYVASYFATQDVNIPKFAHLDEAALEAQWWDTKDFVSEACEITHYAIEEELDRRKADKQFTQGA